MSPLELVVDNPRRLIDFRPPTVPVAPRGYEIEPTTFAHLRAMETHMRPQDVSEITGLGVTVRKALWRAFRNSPVCKTAIIDGAVAAIWGVCVGLRGGVSLLGSQGVPWLHTTAMVERLPVSFVKVGKAELAAMRALYPRLENHVAAEYAGAIRFLRVLGFAVDPALPVGAQGKLYCRFHIGCD